MESPSQAITELGLKPDWKNLPSRRCENCPKIFKPKRPEQRFCSDNCRYQANHFGPGYGRLKLRMDKELRALKAEVHAALKAEIGKDFEAAVKRLQLTIQKLPTKVESAL